MKTLSYIVFLFFLIILGACTNSSVVENEKVSWFAYTDAETLDSNGKYIVGSGTDGDISFKLSGIHSQEHARSGKYSVKIGKKKPYGLTYEMRHLTEGNRFKASVWRYDLSGKAGLVVAGDKTHILYQAEAKAIEKDKEGWELLEIEFYVKPNLDYIKIYAWSIGSDSAWFDDIRIEKLPPKKYPAYTNRPKMYLYFDTKDWAVFERSRQRAFENGILEQSDDDWANGIISDEKQVLPIKARLKGDWLDHLEGVKWSYRVKMRKSKSLNGLRVFSLQNPLTRSNLMEYVAHSLFNDNDVLTTRYGFTPLYVNGESRGVYAVEEHFAKQMIEYNQRREGPILRFNEEAFWGVQKYFKVEKKWYLLPYFQTAIAEAFQTNKTLASPVLSTEFSIAQRLLYQYKTHQKPLNQIFDVEKLAKYWALVDLTKARHGMAWHNQRFYYNPVLCLLEPIAFDAYTGGMEGFTEKKSIYGNLWFPKNAEVLEIDNLLFKIFQDTEFQELYVQNLKKISKEEYLNDFFKREEQSISKYEDLLQEEFPNYKYEAAFIFDNAKRIRQELPAYQKRLKNGVINSYPLKEKILDYDTLYRIDLAPLFVNAFYYKSKDDTYRIRVENYNNRAIELIGLANEQKQISLSWRKKNYRIDAFNNKEQSLVLNLGDDDLLKELVFKVEGKKELLYTQLHPWEKKIGESPRQELLRENNYLQSGIFVEREDTVWIKSGKYQLKNLVIIPKGKFLFIEKGVDLDIVNSGGILSFAPIVLAGTENLPIHIFSSDSTAKGLSIFQTSSRNRIEHTTFSYLGNFEYKGWELSGAVNFYEADVDIDHVRFEHNFCEDALNIIRSDFSLESSTFYATAGDAFDGDFVKGLVTNTSFLEIGNDAFDFSGSQVQINFCEVKSTGDKGVSAGENSFVKLSNFSVSNANIALASKDFSTIEGKEIRLTNCVYGLLAFQKKPEYGSANIKVERLTFDNVFKKYLIEEQSVLQLNKRIIPGSQKKLATRFY